MGQMMSGAASEILAGLQEALLDAQGASVHGLKKTVVYRIQPQESFRELSGFLCQPCRIGSRDAGSSMLQRCRI